MAIQQSLCSLFLIKLSPNKNIRESIKILIMTKKNHEEKEEEYAGKKKQSTALNEKKIDDALVTK